MDPVDRRLGKEIVEDFSMIFDCDDLYAENYDSENYYDFEACFDSKRSAPLIEMQEFCNKNGVAIIGVSYEFSG